jgi:uncharacterized DUF497 family protein
MATYVHGPFEWDFKKDAANREKHKIGFLAACELFDQEHVESEARMEAGERRWLAVGVVRGQHVVVIYTWRGERRRLISARKARENEKEAYQQFLQSLDDG